MLLPGLNRGSSNQKLEGCPIRAVALVQGYSQTAGTLWRSQRNILTLLLCGLQPVSPAGHTQTETKDENVYGWRNIRSALRGTGPKELWKGKQKTFHPTSILCCLRLQWFQVQDFGRDTIIWKAGLVLRICMTTERRLEGRSTLDSRLSIRFWVTDAISIWRQ